MATTRDYYELLGVKRNADDAELKRAFRRKARELHPDVSEAADAEERFREVVEAYEVLSKSETRELYDRFGHAGLQGGGFRPSQFDFGSLTDHRRTARWKCHGARAHARWRPQGPPRPGCRNRESR